MISLKQISVALMSLNISKERIDKAVAEIEDLLSELDEVEVKGRNNLDTLLGCMMALEAIVGKENSGG